MTNEELLRHTGSNELLTTIEQQQRFLLRQAALKKSCPNCGKLVNQFEASKIAVNDWKFEGDERKYTCLACERELLFTLPLVGGWHWGLVPVEVAVP